MKKLHPHMFRHTTATTLVEAGADIASIMEILGHKNIQTTERYLHVSNKHVKKTYQDKMNKFDI
jgi:site-specific recombinase XerD